MKRNHWFQWKKLNHWITRTETTVLLVKTITMMFECISLVVNTTGFLGSKYQNRCLTLCDWLIDSSWRHDFLKQNFITNQKQYLRFDTPGVHQLGNLENTMREKQLCCMSGLLVWCVVLWGEILDFILVCCELWFWIRFWRVLSCGFGLGFESSWGVVLNLIWRVLWCVVRCGFDFSFGVWWGAVLDLFLCVVGFGFILDFGVLWGVLLAWVSTCCKLWFWLEFWRVVRCDFGLF